MQQQAVLAMSLQEQLILSDDEESDEEGEDEACGVRNEEVYDDGESRSSLIKFLSLMSSIFSQTQQRKCSKLI